MSSISLGRPLSFHGQHHGTFSGSDGRSIQPVAAPYNDERISPSSSGLTGAGPSTPTGSRSIAGGGPLGTPSTFGGHRAYTEEGNPAAGQYDLSPLTSPAAGKVSRESERQAASSDESTVRHESTPSQRSRDDDDHPQIGERTDGHLRKAGFLGTASAGAGLAAKHHLAHGGGADQPRGWEQTDVPDKWHLFHPALRKERRGAFKKAALLFTFITLWLWACLSIFWGSTYQLEVYFRNLNVHLVSFDTDAASFLNGPLAQQANYELALPNSVTHLSWQVQDASSYPNGVQDVEDEVIGQKCWAAVVVNANATSAWRTALENGDASYDPTGAITVYYASARFYQVTLLYVQALLSENLMNPLSSARAAALQSFTQLAAADATALTRAQAVPQAVGVAFGYNIHDLRPIPNSAWSAAAPMEASLIYFVIFSFILAMLGESGRMQSGLKSRLTFRSYVGLRLGWPFLAYFFMSLWETLIIRAFQVPLNNILGSAGFVTLWALNWVTLMACGFTLESMMCILGMAFLPYFLILWIIINITSSFFPIAIMPSFYKALYWAPFLHNVEAYKIIAFGTNFVSRLGYHFGILFAVAGVELIGFLLFMVFERWKLDRGKMREQVEKENEKEKKEGA